MSEWLAAEVVPCADPECPGPAEVDQDGELAFYACTVCGAEFGYARLPAPADPTCQLGIPAAVRARAPGPAPGPPATHRGLPLLQIGRPDR